MNYHHLPPQLQDYYRSLNATSFIDSDDDDDGAAADDDYLLNNMKKRNFNTKNRNASLKEEWDEDEEMFYSSEGSEDSDEEAWENEKRRSTATTTMSGSKRKRDDEEMEDSTTSHHHKKVIIEKSKDLELLEKQQMAKSGIVAFKTFEKNDFEQEEEDRSFRNAHQYQKQNAFCIGFQSSSKKGDAQKQLSYSARSLANASPVPPHLMHSNHSSLSVSSHLFSQHDQKKVQKKSDDHLMEKKMEVEWRERNQSKIEQMRKDCLNYEMMLENIKDTRKKILQ